MKNMWKEFKEFINKGDIVMIAVALVMALYFKQIVDQIIAGVITPIIAAIFGESNYESIGFDIGDAFISIGLVIDAIIDFLAVAVVLFFIVKAYNHWKSSDEEAAPTEVELLTEIRDAIRQQQR
jgi:large conductance mechanosensitive channel